MKIITDDLSGGAVRALLSGHLAQMQAITPPESVHALDIDGLLRPDVTVYSVWEGTDLAGCGALKELDHGHGEIKAMRTAKEYLRKGVAGAVLEHIISRALARGYSRLSLETGASDDFLPARSLYAKFGFRECGPFGSYRDDPNSVFMTKELV